MDQRRAVGFVDPAIEPPGQRLDAVEGGRRQAPRRVRHAGHVEQAVVAEEVAPARGRRVGLRQAADHGVAWEAEALAAHRVQRRQQLGGVGLGGGVERVAGLDVVHQQQIVRAVNHRRHRQRTVGGEVAQHEALRLQAGPDLGHQDPAVVQRHLAHVADAAAGQGGLPHDSPAGGPLDAGTGGVAGHVAGWRSRRWASSPSQAAVTMSSTSSKPSGPP